MMVADRKIAWPAQLSIGSRRHGQLARARPQDHGSVDGVADPPLQAGHRGLRGAGRARSTSAIESPRGELGCHLVSDGGTRPLRVHLREPSFVNLQAMPAMSEGGMIADVIAAVASHRPVWGVWTDDTAGGHARVHRAVGRRRGGRVGGPADQPIVGGVFDDLTHAARRRRSSPGTRSRARRCCRCCTSCSRWRATSARTASEFCADALELTDAEVSAVATFYTMYKRTPCGEHLVSVCTNTLCAALGGDAIYATLSRAARGRARARPRASPAPRGRSPWSTPSAWPPATSRRCCRSTTSSSTTRPSTRPRISSTRLQARRAAAPDPRAPPDRLQDRRAGARRHLPRPRRRAVAEELSRRRAETLRGARLAAERGMGRARHARHAAPALPEKERR